jgi:GAF domain-containing protein
LAQKILRQFSAIIKRLKGGLNNLDYSEAEEEIKEIILKSKPSKFLQKVIDFLYYNFRKYTWIGIYLVEKDELILGPWRGKQATEHVKIPVGKGICGSAAASGKTEVIPDVNTDNRYLACFSSTQSEIVVPIIINNKIIGEIDIDSDIPNAFNEKDKFFLEKIADMLSKHI